MFLHNLGTLPIIEKMSPGERSLCTWFGDIRLIGMYFLVIPATYVLEMQKKHSKMQLINYKTFKLQYYLFNPMFNNESRNLLFRLRTRTVSGIKSDFKGIYSDTTCPMRCGQDDTIPHILSCTVLGSHQKSTNISLGKPSKKKGQTWAFGSTSADPPSPQNLGPLIRCNFFEF